MVWSAVGVSHRQVSAETIAALAGQREQLVASLLAGGGVTGVLPLVTCNRVEFILEAADAEQAAIAAAAAFAGIQPKADPADAGPADPPRDSREGGDAALAAQTARAAGANATAGPSVAIRSGADAVQHLFAVAAGLDSLVVGERQIAGQVRHGLKVAEATLTPGLRRLGEAALRTAKAVAGRTGLDGVGRSLAAVGLDLAAVDWTHASVLLLGTGSYAGVVVAELRRRGCTRIAVYSGSERRAARFAETHAVAAVADLPAALGSELVVACSGNRRLVDAPALGAHRPVILDLSGGTDVDPAVRDLGVRLLTIDQLAAHVPAQDAAALTTAQALVEQAVADFLAAERGREAAGTVAALRAQVDELLRAELASTAGRQLPDTQQAIERSLRRFANALLHRPSAQATAAAQTGQLDDYQRALATVFGATASGPTVPGPTVPQATVTRAAVPETAVPQTAAFEGAVSEGAVAGAAVSGATVSGQAPGSQP